jgi:tetratricopeptide (TPR) repeat protein
VTTQSKIPAGAGIIGRKTVLGLMAVGVLAMFATSFVYRMENPSLTERVERPAGMGGMGKNGQMTGPMKEIMELMQGLQEKPEDVALLLRAAEQFMMMNAWERAAVFLDKAASLEPDNPQVLNDQGIALYNMKKPEDALGKFERLLEKNPDDYRARYNLGLLYKYALKNPDKARECFQAVADSPTADEKAKQGAREELTRSDE